MMSDAHFKTVKGKDGKDDKLILVVNIPREYDPRNIDAIELNPESLNTRTYQKAF